MRSSGIYLMGYSLCFVYSSLVADSTKNKNHQWSKYNWGESSTGKVLRWNFGALVFADILRHIRNLQKKIYFEEFLWSTQIWSYFCLFVVGQIKHWWDVRCIESKNISKIDTFSGMLSKSIWKMKPKPIGRNRFLGLRQTQIDQ